MLTLRSTFQLINVTAFIGWLWQRRSCHRHSSQDFPTLQQRLPGVRANLLLALRQCHGPASLCGQAQEMSLRQAFLRAHWWVFLQFNFAISIYTANGCKHNRYSLILLDATAERMLGGLLRPDTR